MSKYSEADHAGKNAIKVSGMWVTKPRDGKGRFRAASLRMVILPLLALALVLALAIVAQPAAARVDEGGSWNGGTLTTYIVVFNDMSPAETQAAYANLEALVEANGGSVTYEFSLIKGMVVAVPDSAVGKLTGFPGVKYIDKDQPARLSMDQVVEQIQISNVRDNPSYNGIDGSGIIICVIDGGVDDSHPDLSGQIIMKKDFMVASGSGDGLAPDDNGHGTFVAGQIAGLGTASMTTTGQPNIFQRTITGFEKTPESDKVNYTMLRGPFKGIATGARLICFKVSGATGDTTHSMVMRAVDYAATKMGDNKPDIISMSINSGVHSQSMDDMMDAAVQSNILVVVSAGNTGPNAQTMECPGDDPNVLTVGSANRDDTVSAFSARGPGVKGIVKPDILAVGQSVLGLKPVWWNQINEGPEYNYRKYYTVMSGTSMATPEVSATAALIMQYFKQIHGVKPTPEQVKYILMGTARQPLGCPPLGDMNWGTGVLNASAAMLYVSTGAMPDLPSKPLATASMDRTGYVVDENKGQLRAGVTVVWSSEAKAGDKVTINYEALSGSGDSGMGAIPGVDYILTPGALTFTRSEDPLTLMETQYISVGILDNGIPDDNKFFNLRLSSDNVATPTLSTVTIRDTDYAVVKFAVNSYSVKNGAGTFGVDVLADRSNNPNAGTIRVDFSTDNGSALIGKDFEASYMSLEFAPDETRKTVEVNVLNNLAAKGVTYFTIRLSNSTGARLGSPSADTVWITGAGSAERMPPVVTYTIGLPVPASGWYNGEVPVVLNAADAGGSGTKYIDYEIQGGMTNKIYADHTTILLSADGENVITYRSADNSGNAASGKVTVKIDRKPPTIYYAGRSPTVSGDGWVNTPISATFSITDPNSGVNGPATVTRTVTGEGYNKSITVDAIDNNGNHGYETVYDSFNIDMSAPISTCHLDPNTGNDGWTNQSTEVTITAADVKLATGHDGSGVRYINYSIDNGATWSQSFSWPIIFTVSNEGTTYVKFFAVDNAGNVERDANGNPNMQRVAIDKQSPQITPNIPPATGGIYYGSVTVTFTAVDRGVAGGVSGIKCISPAAGSETLTPTHTSTTFTATDYAGNTETITVGPLNIQPLPSQTLGSISAPSTPAPLVSGAATIKVTATYSGWDSPITATWGWDDGTTSAGTASGGLITGTHSYSKGGVYTISLTVTDTAGHTAQASYDYVVVYDPNSGFVTGGGWINSLAGYYARDTKLVGKGNFGINCKYTKNNLVPTGETQFTIGSIQFQSTVNEWLVIYPQSSKAIYKGSGTINGAGNYGFLVSAINGSPNRFRIKIWDKVTGDLVYDNQPNAPEEDNPTTPLGGGQIQLHKA